MNPATAADVQERWRPLSADEQHVAETRLDDAWRKLCRLAPGLDARIEFDGDIRANARTAVADAVIRLMQALSRDGVRRGSVAVDDGSAQWDLDASVKFTLDFTADEIASVSGGNGRSRSRAFSVMPS